MVQLRVADKERLLVLVNCREKSISGGSLPAMLSIRQMAQFRQRVVKDAIRTGNISATARIYRVSRQSVHRWIIRYDGSLKSLVDQSKRPHHHPTEHTAKEIALVLRVQRRNKKLGLVCLWVHLKMNFGYKRSIAALYRLLRRKGILAPPKSRHGRKSKPYEPILVPGERFQVDVKHVPRKCLVGVLSGKKLYQYTAIDECTRWRYTEIFEEQSTYSSVEFVKKLVRRFPFEILCIQTDNGTEFTSRLHGAVNPSLFEAYLAEEGIRHKLIAVATPRHNGKVERSHRTDGERFYDDNKFFSLRYIKEQMNRYLYKSNRQPLMAHNWKSAQQMLQNYQYVM
jgi:transposase-like protein